MTHGFNSSILEAEAGGSAVSIESSRTARLHNRKTPSQIIKVKLTAIKIHSKYFGNLMTEYALRKATGFVF